jgi:hypothetical protein
MIDGTHIVSWLVATVLTILVGTCMYLNMLDKYCEEPSIKHGRFWFCQLISAFVAIYIYLTKIGVIIWN